MKNTDIAIVGMSCFFPGAENIEDFWNNLVNGVDSTSEVPENRIDPIYFQNNTEGLNRFYCHKGGFAPKITFEPESFGISSSMAEELEPTHLLALKLVHQALEDAKIFEKGISLKNSSIIIGKGSYVEHEDLRIIDFVHTSEQISETIKNVLPELSEEDITKIKQAFWKDKGINQANSPTGVIPNQITSTIASNFNIEGSAYTVDASCASSLVAVEHSIQQLLSGKTDIAITGGLHFSQNAPFWSVLTQQGKLSHKQKMSPFSEDADGLLIGEGAGFIVLKKLEKALSDNDKIYAVIKGTGVTNNTSDPTSGQKKAIFEAWEKAGIKSEDVGYIEVHGSSIKAEDQRELEVLSDVFKDNSSEVLLGSVKSNIAHTMSASGIAGLIKTALSLYNRQIPATLHSEKPLEQINKNHFSLVQKVTDWTNNKTPLTAGVNAFGLGGINAHIVMQAYGEKNTSHIKSISHDQKVIAVTATSKERLLDALDKRNFTSNLEDSYRLVLFDPTPERIEKARKLIAKDKNWKGRQDIWFTKDPLLKKNGKIAFLFPGFDPSSDPEVDSIADYFGYSIPEESAKENPLLSHAFKQFHGGEIIDSALKKLGVIPDMTAGHSLGEWFAAKSGGLVSNETVNNLLQSLDPKKFEVSDVYFIAAGCGVDRLKPWFDKIPDLYLSNDNCPNQILLCGTETARDSIVEILKSEKIFYQILNFKSGFHSPFIKDKLDFLDNSLEHIELRKNEIPIWSATTLEVYPNTFKEFKELTIKHLLETVRFRELLEKLYEQENARIFIQVGSGSLIGFVDDTLKDKEYSAIPAYVPTRSTLEQMRRVLALLFIEGGNVDTNFLGIKNKLKVSTKEIELSMDFSLVKDFPILKDLSKKYNNQTSFNVNSLDSLFIKSNHPVMQAMNDNLKELISMQTELAELAQQKGLLTRNYQGERNSYLPKKSENKITEPIRPKENTTIQKAGTTFEEPLYIDIKEHPYLIDHSLAKQPKHWENLEDISPVIPMTMTFELLTEAAHKQDLSKKVLRLGPVSVFQWMKVHTPFEQVISGSWKDENIISLGIKNFATAEVTLGDSYSEPPVEYTQEIDLGENVVSEIPTPEQIYRHNMFHGPAYQGIIEVQEVTKKGLRGLIKKSEGKGSLLDNIGQLYGLFLQLTLDNAKVSFPVKVDEINFYQDMEDQKGIFEFICISTSITEFFAIADIIIKRDGKIWCIIKNWKNQRFGFDELLWKLTMAPDEHILAREIAPDIYFFDNAYDKAVSWDFIMKIFLNQEEKRHYESLALNKRKDYLISRIALKDGARAYIEKHFNKKYFPIEFNIQYDANKKPSVHGVEETNKLEISLAHKGTNSVSIISNKPVGIDIETIEDRDKGFLELTFTEKELDLLKDKDLAEWSTRFWTAKEAYGKMLGIGLKGNPKRYEVESIDGERLVIKGTIINTIKYNNNFIIGWTL